GSMRLDILLEDELVGSGRLRMADEGPTREITLAANVEFDAIRISVLENDLTGIIGTSAAAVDDLLV
ncbi:MAG: hypothetical protein AAF390_16890, partial [Pseudomonadota bacterium]